MITRQADLIGMEYPHDFSIEEIERYENWFAYYLSHPDSLTHRLHPIDETYIVIPPPPRGEYSQEELSHYQAICKAVSDRNWDKIYSNHPYPSPLSRLWSLLVSHLARIFRPGAR